MDAQNDSRGTGRRRARGVRCAVCGGELDVLIEIPSHAQPYARNHPAIQYLRCTRCSHIQIVDK